MQEGRCFIVGAGDFSPRLLAPRQGDLLIAADGGYASLRAIGLRPHLVVGDMDSLAGRVRGVPLLRFPVRKDDTDLSLAIRVGRSRGYRRFLLYGASGGEREDHFLAALQLMGGLCQEGLRIRLVAPRFSVYALCRGNLLFKTTPGSTVSVFSVSNESRGVYLRGLDYQAEDLRLQSGFPMGVSNRATGRSALVGVRRGALLVYVAES